MKVIKLDNYEKELLESYERGEWVSKNPKKGNRANILKLAKNSLKKDQTITIRLSKQDLNGIRVMAADKNIPYQTIIASLINQFVKGKIKV